MVPLKVFLEEKQGERRRGEAKVVRGKRVMEKQY
jgi:hypothetical protein